MWKNKVKKTEVQNAEGQPDSASPQSPTLVLAEAETASAPQRAEAVDGTPTHYALVAETAFKPGKGIATELHQALSAVAPATPQQLVDALLGSGAFQRIAPKAAAARPLKVVTTLLNQWVAKGAVVKG